MPKGMLGNSETLRRLMAGPISDLLVKVNGEDGDEWERQFARFLRKETTWELGSPLSSAIAALKLDWVNPNIEKHFTLEPVRRERKVFRFDLSIASEDAVKQMEKEGWSPANLAELLDYAKSEWNGKGWVVALGSSAQLDGYRCVPYLDRYDAKRDLALAWWGNDWDGGCRFLAARN